MSSSTRISKAFEHAPVLPLAASSRYILLSDCHRGIGNANDNFLKNETLYTAALDFYFRRGFTYIELGDGDELWENRSIRKIKEMHRRSFDALARYYEEGRLYLLYGNHDMVKKDFHFREKNLRTYYCERNLCERPLFPGITFHAGIILSTELPDSERNSSISAGTGAPKLYLLHGHQADPLNSTFWQLSRFLVRYVWRPLEKLGIPDPTSAAKNNRRKKRSEEILTRWATENGNILIAGHTHHPMIGTPGSPYCNTGCCIHPGSITGIEIENLCMTLVKWSASVRPDMTMYAMREVLGKTVCIKDYM
ncbi:metallophosphoesterase [Roseburia hominis]